MAKRTLRSLSRAIPTDEDFTRIDLEAENASDRHFALSFAIELGLIVFLDGHRPSRRTARAQRESTTHRFALSVNASATTSQA